MDLPTFLHKPQLNQRGVDFAMTIAPQGSLNMALLKKQTNSTALTIAPRGSLNGALLKKQTNATKESYKFKLDMLEITWDKKTQQCHLGIER